MIRRAFHGAVALLLLAGCGDAPGIPRAVVVINVDTLRADHLGAYGYPKDTSPNLDSLAASSTLFSNAVAPAPWTLPSVATLFTSLYPAVHGAVEVSNAMKSRQPGFRPTSKLHEDFDTLPEILNRNGFATAAFVRGAYPSPVFGFAQGFDHFEDNTSHGTRFSVEQVLGWLDDEQPQRFFVYLHTIEVHSPYTPIDLDRGQRSKLSESDLAELEPAIRVEQERYRSFDADPGYSGEADGSLRNLRDMSSRGSKVSAADQRRIVQLYDRSIRYTDYWIGQLLEGLKERGLLENTLLVVSSDHGEEFWDHGGLEHGRTYFDELLRVPLLMQVPGEGQGAFVQQQVGLIDVLPTILDVLEIPTPASLQGRSLRPLWSGQSLAPQAYFAEANSGPEAFALRTERWKLITSTGRGAMLFDLEHDPKERRDVCAQQRDTCLQLNRELLERRAAMLEHRERLPNFQTPLAEPDAATLERLEALGYVD